DFHVTGVQTCALPFFLLDVDENARRAAAVDPGLVLDGPVPRLIDEWQIEPGLWNHVRRAVVDRGLPGQSSTTSRMPSVPLSESPVAATSWRHPPRKFKSPSPTTLAGQLFGPLG